MTSAHDQSRPNTLLRALSALPAFLLLAAASGAQDYEGYSYFRAVDGRAELIAADSGERTEVETNYPVITGDRLLVDRSARVDVLLSDGSQLAVDEVSDLTFVAVASSPDADETQSQLRLYEGRLLLASRGVWRDGVEAAVIDTANARVYAQANGVYLVTADEARWTEVVVREGFAEVVDQNGSSIVRAGERLEVRGTDSPRTDIQPAGSTTTLEDFADRQELLAARAPDPNLDETVYGTAALADQGDWVVVDGRQAWRPNVRVREWRPYWRGRWVPTPGGLYWVSYDPWSSVVYHYGSWDYDSGFGWLWYPGRVYSPGHVYWYWGPTYAGWVPRGYYDNYYRRHYGYDFGFRFGIFGHIGGSFDYFDRWTFCPIGRFGYRGYSHYASARSLGTLGRHGLERGYLFTDSRRITRDRWHRPELVQVALDRGWRAERGLPDTGGSVPDVTPFVERKGPLGPETERQVLVKGHRSPRTDDPFSTRVAANRPRRESGDGIGSTRSASDRRPVVDRGTTARRTTTTSTRSDRGTPRAITPRPEAASPTNGRSTVVRRPSVGGENGAAAGSRSAPPARRVLDGIRGRGGDQATTSRRTVPPSAERGSSTAPRTSTPPSRRRLVTPPSGGSTRSTTPPSRGSSTRSTTPPSRGGSTRSTSPPSRGSSTRSTTPPSRGSSTRSSTPPSRGSTTRSTAPPSRGSSTRSTSPPSRGSTRSSTPPSRGGSSSSSRVSSSPPSRPSSSSSTRSRMPPSRSSTSAPRSSSPRGRSSAGSGSSSSRSPRTSSPPRASSSRGGGSRASTSRSSGSRPSSRATSGASRSRSSAGSSSGSSRSRSSTRSSSGGSSSRSSTRSSSGSSGRSSTRSSTGSSGGSRSSTRSSSPRSSGSRGSSGRSSSRRRGSGSGS